jgi:hypothetical protein
VSLRLVESTLVPERLLHDTALTTVARVRDALGSDALTHQDSAPKLIHDCRNLVEHVNHGLIKAALE